MCSGGENAFQAAGHFFFSCTATSGHLVKLLLRSLMAWKFTADSIASTCPRYVAVTSANYHVLRCCWQTTPTTIKTSILCFRFLSGTLSVPMCRHSLLRIPDSRANGTCVEFTVARPRLKCFTVFVSTLEERSDSH